MKSKKWHGAMLYLVIMGATSTAVGLRAHADEQLTSQPAVVHSTRSSSSHSSSRTKSASSGPSTTRTKSASSRPSTTSRTKSASSSPSASRTRSAAPKTVAPKVVTIKGDVVSTQYGPVQVAVTFADKKITAVKTLQTPNGDGHSRAVANRAVPILHDEVIASQSAQIDTVSGATYTSGGYAQSVQSAIDKQ